MAVFRSFSHGLLAGVFAIALTGAVIGCASGPKPGPAAVAAVTGPAWKVNSGASELRFVTTKNTNVAETQKFTRLDGGIAPGGAVSLAIDLASVETQVPIRNERMQSLLFEIARFPTATFETVVDLKKVGALAPGESLDMDVAGKLGIHGKTQDVTAALRVVRLTNDRLLVSTRSPVLVSASDFDLTGGIEQLRVLMALPNIVGTVPVTFSIVFQTQS
jgi:polyisoprenoid-binding protein YceI